MPKAPWSEAAILQQMKENPFLLAPMAGITDVAFRSFMKKMGASIVITELVSANGLKYSNERTQKLMEYREDQRPIGIQLFGETPEAMAEAARFIQDKGADFVDLNLGCPVNKVVKKGAGSAWLKDPVGYGKMLKIVRSALEIPLTVKIRTGWTEDSRNSDEICRISKEEGIAWVAIHGRTRAQAYRGKADWNYIKEVKAGAPLPVIGNGDLTSGALANIRLKESRCDGVMIGRGCLKNPWIFKESMAMRESGQLEIQKIRQQVRGDTTFIDILESLEQELSQSFDERIIGLQLKKFASWFSTGYPRSSQFRGELYSTKELKPLRESIVNYFGQIQDLNQADTSHEDFLMGGHG